MWSAWRISTAVFSAFLAGTVIFYKSIAILGDLHSKESKSKLLYDWRSVGQYVLVSNPLWDLWTDIASCRKVAVWKLRSCFCGATSLTRGLVFGLQYNHSVVWVAQNLYPYFTLSSETPQPGGSGSHVYLPRNRVAQLYPQALGSLCINLYD
jgi:hypothetical protein